MVDGVHAAIAPRVVAACLIALTSVPAPVSAAGMSQAPSHGGWRSRPWVPGPLAVTASRELDALVMKSAAASQRAQPRQGSAQRSWIARHPMLFGALAGFGVGCVVGASRVGGSEDNFFNALDEFACPAVGGIGAGVGAVAGYLIGGRK